jgi:hypothetical protein
LAPISVDRDPRRRLQGLAHYGTLPLDGTTDVSSFAVTAARAAGIDELRASHISDYDFRHSRLTFVGTKTDNLSGVMYRPATSSRPPPPATCGRSARPPRRSWRPLRRPRLLYHRSPRKRTMTCHRRRSFGCKVAARSKKASEPSTTWIQISLVISPLCEEGDSNPHGC